MTKSVSELTLCAVSCAVLCVLSPFVIPVGVIPVTLATFGVYTLSAVFGLKRSCVAIGVFLLMGAVGVPVFSGFRGGISVLIGPTGGFLFGYLPCAATVGVVSDRTSSRWALCLSMLFGTGLLYLCGTLWYGITAHVSVTTALSVCVVPFLVFDALKITAATALSSKLKSVWKSVK